MNLRSISATMPSTMTNVGIVRMLVPPAPAVGSPRRHSESTTSEGGSPETQGFLHNRLHHGHRRDLTCKKPVRKVGHSARRFCTMARRFGYSRVSTSDQLHLGSGLVPSA